MQNEDLRDQQPLLADNNNNNYLTMHESRSDPMLRDKKKLPLSGYGPLPTFLVYLLIVTPIWIFLLIPLTLLFQLFNKIGDLFASKPKTSKSSVSEPDLVSLATQRKVTNNSREFDLVVFGATGFTGKMCAVYIAKNYDSKTVRWAIAGRRRDALEKLRDELTLFNKDLKSLPIVIADSSDDTSLDEMTARTRVVITTAGPFAKYGSNLVKWCAVNGTDYGDITGESDWVREMIDKYDDIAKISGARIVSFCGHDCIPWDLAVLECSKFLKSKGDTIAKISFYDEINANVSGGTLATLFNSLSKRELYKSRLGFDPLLKTLSGDKTTNKFVTKNQTWLGYSSEYKHWVGPFVMAMVMANCVRRSNAINNYNSKFEYRESLVYPSFIAGYISFVGNLVFGTCLYCPPIAYIMRKFILYTPGDGPSEKTMDEGFLKITGFATGVNKTKAKVMFYFPTDPGYRDTARMLVESAMVFVLQSDKLKVSGGILTPATCQGDLLTKRLVASGSTFVIE